MIKSYDKYLYDIAEAIEKIEELLPKISKDQFEEDWVLQDAVIRRIAIIGEACKNLPDEVKNQYPDIPWKKIMGMRDILIHDYSSIDLTEVWNVVTKDLSELKQKFTALPTMEELLAKATTEVD